MASIISGVDAKKNLRWNNRVLVTYERLKLQGVKPAAHVTFTPTNSPGAVIVCACVLTHM